MSRSTAIESALRALLEITEAPEPNCSCHVAPPCSDCVEYGALREARTEAQAALDEAPDVFDIVAQELARAVAKFPTWPNDPLHAAAVVGEEAGEFQKAVLQAVYEPHKSTPNDVATEVIQTAAMAIRFLQSMGLYAWSPCEQHNQRQAAGADT